MADFKHKQITFFFIRTFDSMFYHRFDWKFGILLIRKIVCTNLSESFIQIEI